MPRTRLPLQLWRHQFRPEAFATFLLTAVIGFWKPYTLLYITWDPVEQPLHWLLKSNLYTSLRSFPSLFLASWHGGAADSEMQ